MQHIQVHGTVYLFHLTVYFYYLFQCHELINTPAGSVSEALNGASVMALEITFLAKKIFVKIRQLEQKLQHFKFQI